jgi:fused signal recognition particle receptor
MFNFLKNKISQLWQGIGNKLKSLFGNDGNGQLQLAELEKLLLSNDVGHQLTQHLLEKVKITPINNADKLATLLQQELLATLKQCPELEPNPAVLLLVGINGVGKTSFAAKFAHRLQLQGKKVLLVAADTFRAAAEEQLQTWADQHNIALCKGNPNQDPASVVFAGAQQFLNGKFDHLIIDTAGRLHTKSNLLAELEKINKVLHKKLGANYTPATWLVLDAMLGQSSINQIDLFNSVTKLNGLVLTKCDGAAKGGFVFAAAQNYQIPVAYISKGQDVTDLASFNIHEFIQQFLT